MNRTPRGMEVIAGFPMSRTRKKNQSVMLGTHHMRLATLGAMCNNSLQGEEHSKEEPCLMGWEQVYETASWVV